MPDDRVYFVKTANDSLYKVQFIDFEGASTGTSVMQISSVGQLATNAQSDLKRLFSYTAYPNPTRGRLTLAYELDRPVEASSLKMYDQTGKEVLSIPMNSQLGLNVKDISLSLPSGMYLAQLQLGEVQLNQRILVTP